MGLLFKKNVKTVVSKRWHPSFMSLSLALFWVLKRSIMKVINFGQKLCQLNPLLTGTPDFPPPTGVGGGEQPLTGAHPGFSQGGANFFHVWWPVGCEKSILRKLFIILQAASFLPHSKKLKKTDFKDANRVILRKNP